jgi:hypothetical protein
MATAGTPKDKNIKNCSKPSSGAGVASITFVSINSKDKEEIEVFQTVAAQIEQTRIEDKK